MRPPMLVGPIGFQAAGASLPSSASTIGRKPWRSRSCRDCRNSKRNHLEIGASMLRPFHGAREDDPPPGRTPAFANGLTRRETQVNVAEVHWTTGYGSHFLNANRSLWERVYDSLPSQGGKPTTRMRILFELFEPPVRRALLEHSPRAMKKREYVALAVAGLGQNFENES